jgi:hypothetical protein
MDDLVLVNVVRELEKTLDLLRIVDRHFLAEADMNAALHMSTDVRPAPLAAAIHLHIAALDGALTRLRSDDG